MFRMLAPLLLIAAAAPAQMEQMLKDLHGIDVRIANLIDRIAVGGAALCPLKVRRWPLVLEDAATTRGAEREAATRLFGLGAFPVISHPEALAGQAVVAIDGKAIGPAVAKAPHGRIDQIEEAIERGATLTLIKAGKTLLMAPPPRYGCPSRAQVVPTSKHIAEAADGIIVISTAIIDKAVGDEELSFTIAHEMAHNILQHKAVLDRVGRKTANILATEIEADRLALKLMKASGFDPAAAARLWAHYGTGLADGILSDGTHLRGKERAAFLRAEAAKLNQ
jgi:beta-barrel assembly-enhancing protease